MPGSHAGEVLSTLAPRRTMTMAKSPINYEIPTELRDFAEKSVEQPAQAGTVYVTKTGTKYHRAGCRHLTDSARAIPLTEAMRSLQPCKNCKPPQ